MQKIIITFILLLVSTSSYAIRYEIPKDTDLLGKMQIHMIQKGEFFHPLAEKYEVAFLSLLEANPEVDPFLPKPGTRVVVPTAVILPDVEKKGIVINLAELKLYYFPNQDEVYIFPIGIGVIGRETPTVTTRIRSKIPAPTWTPTKNIRKAYKEERGIILPPSVPAGPDNPLGKFALRLDYGDGTYLIHGTNKDFGIGMRVSSGCIRLDPQNIEWLFSQVKVKEQVRIINDTVKLTTYNGTNYMEVHSPLSKTEEDMNTPKSKKVINLTAAMQKRLDNLPNVDFDKVKRALDAQMGYPVSIDKDL